MKATIEFNLPDEQHAYKAANLSSEMSGVLWDLDSFLRSGIKYGPDGDQWETAEALAAHIRREYLSNIIDRLEC
jgi:hypothetical protein